MMWVVSEIVMYTRPGCPFCFKLRLKLRLRRVAFREVNIRQDTDAAAAVRAAADGNETVPTVHVGGSWLVNPSLRAVLTARTEHDEGLAS
jgi:mycoredoxin